MQRNRGASKEAIQYHYDVGNDFYAAWLDESMSYSAAIWPEAGAAIDLRQAQERKLDWHIEGSKLGHQRRLLDIGCGWGGLIQRAAETKGFSQAVGLTLSEAQAAWIAEQQRDRRVTIEVAPWQAYQVIDPFDAIISIGAFEHFARPGMTRAQKIDSYRAFFAFCAEALSPGGTLSLQTIVWMEIEAGREADNLPADFFPESDLPYVSEVIQAAEEVFHLTRFHNRPRDYSKTLRAWLKGISDQRESLIADHGEAVVMRYMTFFTRFVFGFDRNAIGLTRMKFIKRR